AGGVSAVGGSISLYDTAIIGNHSGSNVGGLRAAGTDVTIVRSTISDNTAEHASPGMQAGVSGDVTITDTTLSGNTTNTAGWGSVSIRSYAPGGTVELDDVVFADNADSVNIGGFAEATLSGLDVTGNDEGGLRLYGGDLVSVSVRDAEVTGNGGVGLNISADDASLSELIVERNTAGGLRIDSDHGVVTGASVLGNEGWGGVQTTGDVTIEASTVAGNTAGDGGGSTVAGGISGHGGRLTVVSSTVSGNDGGGVAFQQHQGDGELVIEHSTITANDGAGVAAAGYFIAFETCVDGYYQVDPPYQYVCAEEAYVEILGTVATTLDHAVVDGSTDADVVMGDHASGAATWSLAEDVGSSGITSVGGNIVGASAALGALADNGGPTLTHLPTASSPVVDAGDAAADDLPETDQRGSARVAGAAPDLGAVEWSAAPDGGGDDGDGDGDDDGGRAVPDDDVYEGADRPLPGSDRPVVGVETPAGTVRVTTRPEVEGGTVEVTVRVIAEGDVDGDTRGFSLLGRAFEIEVEGDDGTGGEVCLPYSDEELAEAGWSETDLQLFHFTDGGGREVVAARVDEHANEVCVDVSSFSPFAVGVLRTDRLAGVNADWTAVAVSRATFPGGAPVAHLVERGAIEAHAAATAAARRGGPLLLVERDGQLPHGTRRELARLAPAEVVRVRDLGDDASVTAAALSRSAFPDGASTVYVANRARPADALVGAAAAAADGAPLLFVDSGSVPAATAAEIERLGADRVVVVGGAGVVGDAVVRALGATRLAGVDRYATSAVVLAELGGSEIVAARGDDPSDALAASVIGRPVVLVHTHAVGSPAEALLADLEPTSITVVGGLAAVSLQTEADLARHLR
ncbi:MAG TPA: cell wall-binding repeat-containing protein, partial [Acidimicrobiales bacterium]|nr:cell wall-binding repeat-containing protein [Acidimicrobiales bacterium]